MLGLQKLKATVRDGIKILKRDKSLLEGTVYASANRRVVGRLVYTHHFPCQGLQEPKSEDDFGVSVQGHFKRGDKRVVGFGHIANDVSPNAVKRALERARANTIYDPDFHGFPRPVNPVRAGASRPAEGSITPPSALPVYAAGRSRRRSNGVKESGPRIAPDPRLLALVSDPKKEARVLADMSFRTLEGALRVFRRHHRRSLLGELGVGDYIVSGDNFLVTERSALASTTGIGFGDESTIAMSLLSAMVERAHSKGRGWQAASRLRGFEAERAGREAAEQALSGVGGEALATGNYTVVLGPQAATEIFSNLLLTSFSASTLDFGVSVFNGRFGERIASSLLSIADDATMLGAAGSKTFTDDGYRTRRIPLVERGRFAGFLLNDYYRKKLLAQSDAALEEKIGPDARRKLEAEVPRSGFRFGGGGGRLASQEPGISATNLVISSAEPVSRAELLSRVKNGVYIGALWYTYPIAGYKAGEISGTAVADTYRIRNGKIAEPIRVNSLRIRGNLRDIVKNIVGITRDPRPTILWASDEITYAPEVAVRGIHCEAIRHPEA